MYLPCNDYEEVDHVPWISKVGMLMYDKSHSNDFEETLNGEDHCEYCPNLTQSLVVQPFIISILIISHG